MPVTETSLPGTEASRFLGALVIGFCVGLLLGAGGMVLIMVIT